MQAIPRQVTLPLRVALGVVSQGIRIRLGRSLVTLTGVVLGVAFLASILASRALKQSVSDEDRVREAASRAYGYLAAETGPVFDKKVALVLAGAPTKLEQRLVSRIEREGAREIAIYAGGAALPNGVLEHLTLRRESGARELGADSVALLLLGAGAPPALDWSAALAASRQHLLALGAQADLANLPAGATRVRLIRALPPEERARLERSARSERFRGFWIVGISLLVTVIGISNSMLMSVSERFRDIGTMKCLGAQAAFIRRIFLLEASFMGVVGGVSGVLLGDLFSLVFTLIAYGPRLSLHALGEQWPSLLLHGALSLAIGALLSVVASLYPAEFAARMLPAAALRSNV